MNELNVLEPRLQSPDGIVIEQPYSFLSTNIDSQLEATWQTQTQQNMIVQDEFSASIQANNHISSESLSEDIQAELEFDRITNTEQAPSILPGLLNKSPIPNFMRSHLEDRVSTESQIIQNNPNNQNSNQQVSLGKLQQRKFKAQIENACALRQSTMKAIYHKRHQRHQNSHLFENNPKLSEISRDIIGKKIVQFRQKKAKEALEKKKIEELLEDVPLYKREFYTDSLQFSDSETITVRADKLSKLEPRIFQEIKKVKINGPTDQAPQKLIDIFATEDYFYMITLDLYEVVSIIVFKEKTQSSANYMNVIFSNTQNELPRTNKLFICGLNKVCQRGRYSHVVVLLPNNKSESFAQKGFLYDSLDQFSLAAKLKIQMLPSKQLMFYRPPNHLHDCYGKKTQSEDYPSSDFGNLSRNKQVRFNQAFSEIQLQEKLSACMGHGRYKRQDQARDIDQYETTALIIKRIKRVYKIKQEDEFDPCQFALDYDSIHFYNALKKPWPLNKVIFMNHPFSLTSPFLLKCALEYRRGCSIIIICPSISIETTQYDTLIYQTAQRRIQGSVAFRDWMTANKYCHSIIEFIQPDVYDKIDYLSTLEDQLLKNFFAKTMIKSNKKIGRPHKDVDVEQIQHLLEIKWTQKEISNEFKIHNRQINRVRQMMDSEQVQKLYPNREEAHQQKLIRRKNNYALKQKRNNTNLEAEQDEI